MPLMTVKDLEQLQATLSQAGLDYQKINLFLRLGAEVGILIDPDKQTVTVYRPTGTPVGYARREHLCL